MPDENDDPRRDPFLDVIRATTQALVDLSACVRALEKSADEQRNEVRKALEDVEREMRLVASAIRDYAATQERIAEAQERVAEVEEDRRGTERTTEIEHERRLTARWGAATDVVRQAFAAPAITIPLGALIIVLVQIFARLLGVDLDLGGLVK